MEDEEKPNNEEIEQPEENLVLSILFENFNEYEKQRWDFFKNSKFDKAKIKKKLNQYFGNVSISDSTLEILKTVCKVYMGELIEESLIIMNETNEKGPIEPTHLREAYRRLEFKGKTANKNMLDQFSDI